jgi:hypothetical protein
MISWLTFKGYDGETDRVARESIFRSGRLLKAADTAAIVQLLPSECYERLFELTRAMAFQRAVFEPERGGMICSSAVPMRTGSPRWCAQASPDIVRTGSTCKAAITS